MASCSVPAEKTILPMWPEPPFRSSSVGSDLAFMACTPCVSRSTSPSGSSTEVQKNCRPPISAAPSISTPRLPPSLRTFFSLAFLAASGSSAFLSSLAGAFSSLPLPPFSFLPPFCGACSFPAAPPPAPPPAAKSLAAARAASSFEGSAAWPWALLALPPPLPSIAARILSDHSFAETLPSRALGTAQRTASLPPALLRRQTALLSHFFCSESMAKLRAFASSRLPASTTATCMSPAA
mmetsp:Transcript_136892/g.425290  ORF Transcript_136892/g.425290 Transcript_136892/m.425290 type:complete len:238 (+) Transcript_136892:175-888(+)